MTTEDDFQAALDADPGNWQTRLVFADWLQERGDERADGYRALGALRLSGRGEADYEYVGWAHTGNRKAGRSYARSVLARDWWDLLSPALGSSPDATAHS